MTPARFPHSDTPGSTLGCQLPRAYRRLLRPSSALDAKASTMCPSQLVTHTTNPTPPTNRWHQAGDAHNTPQKNHTPPPQSDEGAQKTIKHTKTHPPQHPIGPHNMATGQAGASSDARVHYPDLKQQPHTHQHAPTRDAQQAGHAAQNPALSHRAMSPARYRSPSLPAPGPIDQEDGSSDSSEPQQCGGR